MAGVLAARRGDDGTSALDEALAIAVRTGEALRLVPVAAARAEAAWIAGRTPDLIVAIDRAWPSPSPIRTPGDSVNSAGGCASPETTARP